MNVLLINPPCQNLYKPFLPLGLAYLAGSLMISGDQVTIWDLNIEKWSQEEIIDKIKRCNGHYQIVGLSALPGDYPFVEWFCQIHGKHQQTSKLIIGGYLASALPRFLMENLPINYVVVGEGEETILELRNAIQQGSLPTHVNGVYYRDHQGQIHATPARERFRHLDLLPRPAWELFPMEQYLASKNQGFDTYGSQSGGIMSIMASRGCPFHCNYCDHTIKGYQVRYRSVENVVSEIKALIERYGSWINCFYFWDDILIDDHDWVYDFCERLNKESLKIRWTCNCHVNRIDPRLMACMKNAGCFNVRFGIESGSQKILNALKKGVKVEKALQSLRICLEAGLSLTMYLMVGMRGETKETIHETLSFLKKLITPSFVHQSAKIHFFMLTPFPGTQLFQKAKDEGLIGDYSSFLKKGLDAYHDLPLNISGQEDEELKKLKAELENSTNQIIMDHMHQFRDVLFDMHRELQT